MGRLNLTLDRDTDEMLARHAREARRPRSALARELLREGLRRVELRQRQEQLAHDYAAGRRDAKALLVDLEAAQLELLDDLEDDA